MFTSLLQSLRDRPRASFARVFVLAIWGVLALNSIGFDTHAHESELEAAQCVVCHWSDPHATTQVESVSLETPPIRIVDHLVETPLHPELNRRFLPPATGPPASA